MRVAIVNSSRAAAPYDPIARMAQDLAGRLADRGHRVALIGARAGEPGPAGVEVVLPGRLPPVRGLDWYEREVDAAPGVIWHLLRGSYDVAHAFDPIHAWTAARAGRLGAPPTVFSLNCMPERRYLVGRRHRIELLRANVAGCAATTVPSERAATLFRRYLMATPTVLRPGIAAERFRGGADRADVPTLVCGSGSPLSARERETVLEAFALLREGRPEARLLMIDSSPDAAQQAARDGVVWVDLRSRDELAAVLAAAWVTVVPDDRDATGLAAIESLAAGTPVAAPAPLATEVLGEAPVGRGCDPGDATSVADAIEAALRLATEPGIRDTCRERAAEYAWERALPAYEDLYLAAVGEPVERRSLSQAAER